MKKEELERKQQRERGNKVNEFRNSRLSELISEKKAAAANGTSLAYTKLGSIEDAEKGMTESQAGDSLYANSYRSPPEFDLPQIIHDRRTSKSRFTYQKIKPPKRDLVIAMAHDEAQKLQVLDLFSPDKVANKNEKQGWFQLGGKPEASSMLGPRATGVTFSSNIASGIDNSLAIDSVQQTTNHLSSLGGRPVDLRPNSQN